MSKTDKFRVIAWSVWVIAIFVALAGWCFYGRDPSQLSPLIGWITGACAVGEGANVGKRATFNKDAIDAERDASTVR